VVPQHLVVGLDDDKPVITTKDGRLVAEHPTLGA